MNLILLRHGKAEDHNPGGDYARALVERGREQARKQGRLLKGAGLLPDIVLTSPLLRARQTADEFCEAAGIPGPVIQGWIASGMNTDQALTELAAFKDFRRVMIVGHEPDFSQFLIDVLGVSVGDIEMKKGAIACLRISPPSKRGTLTSLIPPKLADDVDD